MYSSEYLRNKLRAAPKIIIPTQSRDAGAFIQEKRAKSATISTQKGGDASIVGGWCTRDQGEHSGMLPNFHFSADTGRRNMLR